MKTFGLILALGAQVTSGSLIWDYKTYGADWAEIDKDLLAGNKCGGTNQSPIDLKTHGWPEIEAHHDKFYKVYSNQEGEIEIGWTGHTSQVAINKVG